MTLRSAPAFRDFGGHAVDGGRVRRGVLYRSEVLAGLDPDDRTYVDRLALRLVCDLRNVKERERTPCLDWLAPAPERLLFDVTSAFRPTAKLSLDRLLSDTSADAARDLMIVTYESIPAAAAPHLRELSRGSRPATCLP